MATKSNRNAAKSNRNGAREKKKPPVPTTEQLLARVYPLSSGSRVKVEPKATDLSPLKLKHWLKDEWDQKEGASSE